ncbi:uncharacterized protein LOC141983500 [Natator depressus]|uniref:uncharacterized protein LOC141983500 n=1 Tax=Natator depressus TaxID=27790 RepID=UPI003EB8350E
MILELRQAYQKTREANGRSGSEPKTCRFYDELHAILGGSATTTPAVLFDSFNGDGGNTEAGFGDEEDDDDDDEVVDSSQQASGETSFPDSQELFLTLDLEPVPPEPTQGCLLDPAGGEGTSAACVSMITGSSPSQTLVKIRKKKKRTRDEMFSELMLSSHTDRAQTNAWRQIMSDCRKAQNDQEERWRAEESKWRAEERAEARMWRQRDERRHDSMLRLLEDQTSMLQCMVELQQRQLEHRLPLQPLCNQPPSSPSSIASTPRCPRTRLLILDLEGSGRQTIPASHCVAALKVPEKLAIPDWEPEVKAVATKHLKAFANNKLRCRRIDAEIIVDGPDPKPQSQYCYPVAAEGLMEIIQASVDQDVLVETESICNSPIWPVKGQSKNLATHHRLPGTEHGHSPSDPSSGEI